MNQSNAHIEQHVDTVKTELKVRQGKYLTFKLESEEYGVEIDNIHEIIGIMDITAVPTTPSYIRGVINLRGKVIPVIELRAKFGLASKEDTVKTCIIVVELQHEQQTITMGVIVDEVSEVQDIHEDQLEPPPRFNTSTDTAFILGVGNLKERVVLLLDLGKVLKSDEVDGLERLLLTN